jgi:hypothetical protein
MINEYGIAGGMRIENENLEITCSSAILSTINPT